MKKTPVFHRLMALFLVLVLAFSLTATVFATEASSTESTEPTAEVTGSPPPDTTAATETVPSTQTTVPPSEPEETSATTQPPTVPPTTVVETEDITVPTTEETLPPEAEPTAPPSTDPPVTEPQPNNSLPTDPQEAKPEELSQEEIDALLAEILADAPSAYVPRTWLAAQLALRTGLEPVMPLAGTVIPVSSDGITIPQTWYGLAWKRSSGAWEWWYQPNAYWTTGIFYFTLDNGQTAYCIEPFNTDTAKGSPRVPLSWDDIEVKWGGSPWNGSFEIEKQRGIARVLCYGSPNNGDTSANGKLATAALIWDMACGYRNEDGTLRMSGYSSPFGRAIQNYSSDVYEKYQAILTALSKHGTIPSFAGATAGAAPVYNMTVQPDGSYKVVLTDTNGVLEHFHYSTTVSGVSISQSGNTLTITATAAAAAQLGSGLTISSRGSSAAIGPDVTTVWASATGADTQMICSLDTPMDPSPSFFKLTTPTVKVTLKKSIDASAECIAQLQGNAMYSLAGAQYTISLNGVVQETLTTQANGEVTSSKSYNVGDRLVIKETVAPPGFLLDRNTYTYTVTSGENVISVRDVPIFDPPFAITKVDKTTGDPQGNASFSGAVFKWEYFDNDSWSGTPVRTWHFKTDAQGWARYNPSYFAPGYVNDALYRDTNGINNIPLGTVKITEVVNSLGYIVLPQSLYCSIVEDATALDGVKVVWSTESWDVMVDMLNGNFGIYEPIDESLFGRFTFAKRDSVLGSTPQGSAALAGAKYQVINKSANAVQVGAFPTANPGQVCYEFTTDSKGQFDSGRIFPMGLYEMREVDPSTGYRINSGWSVQFEVTADKRDFVFTGDSGCPETVIRGGVQIIKQDRLLGDATPEDAPLAGITFSIVNENPNPVVVDGKTYQPGETVLTLPITWDGMQWSASTAADALPYGDYTLLENPAAGNAELANDYYFLNPEGQKLEIRDEGVVIAKTFQDDIRPGNISILKVDPLGNPLAGAKFLLEWSADGVSWQPVTASSAITQGGCASDGLAEGCLVSGQDGLVSFDGLHPALFYRLTEVEAPNGYLLLPDAAWEGLLPIDNNLTVELTVHNSPGYTLPNTGEWGAILLPLAGALLLAAAVLGLCWKKQT